MTKILVIEDDQTILDNIVEVLALEGYETTVALDGINGIERAVTDLPDLILCDIRMPHADGHDVYKALSQNPKTASIPFVFMTAKTNGADIQRIKEQETVDYLSKPFEIDTLLNLIQARTGGADSSD